MAQSSSAEAFNNDDDLDPKAVKAWERSVKALFAALEVATFACRENLDNLRRGLKQITLEVAVLSSRQVVCVVSVSPISI